MLQVSHACPFPPPPPPRSPVPLFPPPSKLQELHERRITFMEGSAVSGQDLVAARAERARACLLLADRFTTDPEQEDLSILFQVCVREGSEGGSTCWLGGWLFGWSGSSHAALLCLAVAVTLHSSPPARPSPQHNPCPRKHPLPLQVWAMKSYTKTVPLYVQTVRQSMVDQISPFLDPGQDVVVSMEQTRLRWVGGWLCLLIGEAGQACWCRCRAGCVALRLPSCTLCVASSEVESDEGEELQHRCAIPACPAGCWR